MFFISTRPYENVKALSTSTEIKSKVKLPTICMDSCILMGSALLSLQSCTLHSSQHVVNEI